MSGKTFIGRRDALKSISGAVVSGSVLTGSVAGKGKNGKKVGMVDAGVVQAYNSLLDEYKFDDARQLLVESDVAFNSRKYTRNSDSLRNEDFFAKGSSSATFDTNYMGVIDGEETWALVLTWDLAGITADVDTPAPQDKAALAYNSSVWGYADDSMRHSGRLNLPDGSTLEGVTSKDAEPVSDMTGAGVVKFDDRYNEIGTTGEGFMQFSVRRIDENSQGIVAGSYAHTWSAFGGSEIDLDVSLGIISWGDPLGTDRWVLPNDNDRDVQL